jgi:hypothetical protein
MLISIKKVRKDIARALHEKSVGDHPANHLRIAHEPYFGT